MALGVFLRGAGLAARGLGMGLGRLGAGLFRGGRRGVLTMRAAYRIGRAAVDEEYNQGFGTNWLDRYIAGPRSDLSRAPALGVTIYSAEADYPLHAREKLALLTLEEVWLWFESEILPDKKAWRKPKRFTGGTTIEKGYRINWGPGYRDYISLIRVPGSQEARVVSRRPFPPALSDWAIDRLKDRIAEHVASIGVVDEPVPTGLFASSQYSTVSPRGFANRGLIDVDAVGLLS